MAFTTLTQQRGGCKYSEAGVAFFCLNSSSFNISSQFDFQLKRPLVAVFYKTTTGKKEAAKLREIHHVFQHCFRHLPEIL